MSTTRWRAWIRYGSILVVLATLVPSLDGLIMWVNVPTLIGYAWGKDTPPFMSHPKRALMVLFSTYTFTLLLIGWLGIWISRKAGGVLDGSRPIRRGTRVCAWLLLLVTWVPPYASSMVYLESQRFYDPERFLWWSSAYHVAVGLWIAWAVRRYRGTPAALLSVLVVPVTVTLVAWASISYLFLPFWQPGPYRFTHNCVIGLAGAVALLVGTMGAWSASRRPA